MISLKFKKMTETASTPFRVYDTDSGFDIASDENTIIHARSVRKVATGNAFDIPHGYEIQIRPRSGLSADGVFAILGTIDQGYRDQVYVTLFNAMMRGYPIRRGDRIAQIVLKRIDHDVELEEVEELSETPRGKRGHGSSGR